MAKKRVEDIQDIIKRLEQSRGELVAEFLAYERMYLIEPEGVEEGSVSFERVKPLLDPHPHNTINTLINLYATKPPVITVNLGEIGKEARDYVEQRDAADRCEQFVKALFEQNPQVVGKNPFIDSLASVAIFGEVTIVPINLLAEQDEGDSVDIELPFIFRVPNPQVCYPATNERGLVRHAIIERLAAEELQDYYPDFEGTGEVELVDYVDKTYRLVYTKQDAENPLVFTEHKLPFIPRVYQLAAFPSFFGGKNKIIPFLYALRHSKMWGARNLNLTLMNTNIFEHLNPLFVSHTEDGRAIPIAWNQRGVTIPLRLNERIEPLAKNLVPSEQFTFFSVVSQLVEDATMSRIARGVMPSGAQWAASAINTLAESTRMAVNRVAEPTEFAWSRALNVVLRWIKERGKPVTIYTDKGSLALKPSDIYPNFTVRVKLKPDQAIERQMVIGTIAALWDRHLIGYETATELLESVGVAPSAVDLMQDILYRGALETELPNLLKQMAQAGRELARAAENIPETPPVQAVSQVGGGSGMESLAGYAPRNPLEQAQNAQAEQPAIPGVGQGR